MENQHRKISTYSELTQVEIDLMNEIKQKESELLKLINRLEAKHTAESKQIDNDLRCSESEVALAALQQSYSLADAMRFTVIAKDHIQIGLMALTRAVARPLVG
jgi:hypothetical protein